MARENQEEEIKPSDDAIAIANAIYAGFELLARAIERREQSDDTGEPVEPLTYLDGSIIK